jgi:hypothetical protein
MSDDIKPLNTVEASKYLWDKWRDKKSPHTLETYRSRGGGPEHFYIGVNAFYWPADLDVWVQSRMTPKVSSASEGRQIRLAQRKHQNESKPSTPDPSNAKKRTPHTSKSKPNKPTQRQT